MRSHLRILILLERVFVLLFNSKNKITGKLYVYHACILSIFKLGFGLRDVNTETSLINM